ncbi:MFS transporter [Jiangella muralis]|uniref:MFS transporter n=1 Tax=Jiangella muralis TaxID=702383 RepID=UPI001969F0B9|nr:MFS transporter [Jiangella muralis]
MALAVLALPTLLVSLDTFVMVLALPEIATSLGASSTEQLWVMDIYGFMVGGLMITMGTLGDRIGRRRLLLIGGACFGVASLVAAFSTSALMLIGARAALGIAGAALTPSTLALISNIFTDAKQRATAIGVWAACFAAGAILGPIAGGVLLEHFWWGSVMLLGVPAMVLLLVVGPALLPEYRDHKAGRLDMASVALSLAMILPIIFGLKELAREGWQVVPFASVVIGVVAGWCFVRRQSRLADPLIDLRLFTDKVFNTTLGSMFAFTMLSGSAMIFLAQYVQLVEGWSPLRAAYALLPGMVAGLLSFQVAPILSRRIRPGVLLPAGLAVSVVGFLVMLQTTPGSGVAPLIIGFAISSVGGGPLLTVGIGLVVGSAPPEKAGSASGIAQTANEFGYAFGVAVLGSVLAAAYRIQMTGSGLDIPDAARHSLAGAVESAADVPSETVLPLLAAAHDAYATGLHAVALTTAVGLAIVAVCLAVNLQRPRTGASDD